MVYQEQVMQIVRDLAGYTYGRSDLVRRSMAKKKEEEMFNERKIFIYGEEKNGIITVEGCLRKGISLETANTLFDQMIDFASYAFNKSHATAYAYITYQTAYLKHYYPKEYMTAYLNSLITNQDKLKKYIGITKKMGIEVFRPNINESEKLFKTTEKGIYFGLLALKNIGLDTESIIIEREKNGKFNTISDFLLRINIGKKELLSFSKSGALDELCDRSDLIKNPDKILKSLKTTKKILEMGQMSMFDEVIAVRKADTQFSQLELLTMEKEISGLYLSGHPLDLEPFKKLSKNSNITSMYDFTEKDNQKIVRIVGIINFDNKKEGTKISKKGNKYSVFHIEDRFSELDVLAFSSTLEDCGHCIKNGNICEVFGKLSINRIEYENSEGEIEEKIVTKILAEEISLVA
jgi:DNA polymerase-3 subunit alpha